MALLTVLICLGIFAEDWATCSDEYVMVENEYEDVGRKVLDGQDLNVSLDEKVALQRSKLF